MLLFSFLTACGGDDRQVELIPDGSVAGNTGPDNSVPDSTASSVMTYKEAINLFESQQSINNAGSLSGVWILISEEIKDSLEETAETSQHTMQTSLSYSVFALRENTIDENVMLAACAIDPNQSESVIKYEIVLNNNIPTLFFGADPIATVETASKIVFLDRSNSDEVNRSPDETERWALNISATMLKVSDDYRDSMGTISVEGQTRSSACFSTTQSSQTIEKNRGRHYDYGQCV